MLTQVLLGLLIVAGQAVAQSLLLDLDRARANDPDFATALTDDDRARLDARIAGMAYYPRARFSATQLDNESAGRQTFSVTQPIIDPARWFTRQELAPRLRAADAQLSARTQQLAVDVFQIVGEFVRAREKLRLTFATIAALEDELRSAEQRFQRGVGTITDVYDARLKLAEARASRLAQQAALDTARRQYAATMGEYPADNAYHLRPSQTRIEVPQLDALLAQALTYNPRITVARVGIELSDLDRRRSRAEYLPSVNARVQRSWSDGDQRSSSGVILSLDLPLDAARVFRGRSVELDGLRARQQARATEQQIELDVRRLHSTLDAAQARLQTLREAIAAAELSLEATERSFRGGVRSKIDVINAILALDNARSNEIEALIALGETWLALQLLAAIDHDHALQALQSYFFEGT